MSVEDCDAVIKVHLNGAFYVSRAAAAALQGAGVAAAFVHMTSTSGLIGNFGQANYAAAKLGIVGAVEVASRSTWQRFNVRSNCIAPFAWSRMIGTIPDRDAGAAGARRASIKQMTPDKIAPLAVCLACDAAQRRHRPDLRRAQERDLPDQPAAPDALACTAATAGRRETVAEHALPGAASRSFYALDRSADVFSWDPV